VLLGKFPTGVSRVYHQGGGSNVAIRQEGPTMRRLSFLFALPLTLFALAACESPTGLDEITMEGRWDLVGDALKSGAPSIRLQLNAEDESGSFTGIWHSGGFQGAVIGVRETERSVQFILSNFNGQSRTFEGTLADIWIMEGQIDLGQETTQLPRFRRTNFRP
jgi:hypothetical protein